MGADLRRARAGQKTRTSMSASQLEDFATTPRRSLPARVSKKEKTNDYAHGSAMRGRPPAQGYGRIAVPFSYLGHYVSGHLRPRADRDVTPPPQDVPSQWREPSIREIHRPGFRSRMPMIESMPPPKRRRRI
jgi:hypothetical protein